MLIYFILFLVCSLFDDLSLSSGYVIIVCDVYKIKQIKFFTFYL